MFDSKEQPPLRKAAVLCTASASGKPVRFPVECVRNLQVLLLFPWKLNHPAVSRPLRTLVRGEVEAGGEPSPGYPIGQFYRLISGKSLSSFFNSFFTEKIRALTYQYFAVMKSFLAIALLSFSFNFELARQV